jgi:hypothetical protein
MGRIHTGFWLEIKRERDHQSEIAVRGRIILKWIFEQQGIMDWTDTAQNRNQWMTFVNMVMNLLVS